MIIFKVKKSMVGLEKMHVYHFIIDLRMNDEFASNILIIANKTLLSNK